VSLSRDEIAAVQAAHEAACAEAAPRNWKGELIDGDVETPAAPAPAPEPEPEPEPEPFSDFESDFNT